MTDTFNLKIDQGADFSLEITYEDASGDPLPLTGYTAAMQIRRTTEAPTAVLTLDDPDGLTLGGAAGTILVEITAAQTAALPVLSNGLRYDLEITSPGGTVTRLLEGRVYASPEVTRV